MADVRKLPFFAWYAGKDCYGIVRHAYVFRLLLAPFPLEEQVPGEYARALLHLEITFRPHRPFLGGFVYCADRGGPRD